MVDGKMRPVKDAALMVVAQRIPPGITPTMITLASLSLGIAAAVLAAMGLWTGALVAFLVNRCLDGLDGLVARYRNVSSDRGGYLDIMVDFLVYAAVPAGVWYGVPGENAGPLILLLAAFYINSASWMYLAAIQEKHRAAGTAGWAGSSAGARGGTSTHDGTSARGGTSTHDGTSARGGTTVVMPPGLIEGTETLVFYVLFLAVPQWYGPLFLIMAATTLLSAALRFFHGWRALG